LKLSYLHALHSSTVVGNGSNVSVGLPGWEASQGFQPCVWSHHAGTGTGAVNGGDSWGGDH